MSCPCLIFKVSFWGPKRAPYFETHPYFFMFLFSCYYQFQFDLVPLRLISLRWGFRVWIYPLWILPRHQSSHRMANNVGKRLQGLLPWRSMFANIIPKLCCLKTVIECMPGWSKTIMNHLLKTWSNLRKRRATQWPTASAMLQTLDCPRTVPGATSFGFLLGNAAAILKQRSWTFGTTSSVPRFPFKVFVAIHEQGFKGAAEMGRAAVVRSGDKGSMPNLRNLGRSYT